jgi:hypothetical protein
MMADPRKDQKPAQPQHDDAELSDEALEQVAGGLPVERLPLEGETGIAGLTDFDETIVID